MASTRRTLWYGTALAGAIAIGIVVAVATLIREITPMTDTMTMTLTAPFHDDGAIPARYTCDGDNTPPALTLHNVPAEARSLVLIMDDPDVPAAVRPDKHFTHWVLFDIAPTVTTIDATTPGTPGRNDTGNTGYVGPCPPTQYTPTTHRYVFRVFALDVPRLGLDAGAAQADVEAAMRDHIIATATLTGRYDRTWQ